MKRENNLLFIFLFLYPFFLNAQAPGYLGKRASIALNFSSFPAFLGPSQNNKGFTDFNISDNNYNSVNEDPNSNYFFEKAGTFGFNYQIGGNISYVISRFTSLSLLGGQYYTGAVSQVETNPINSPNSTSSFYDFDQHLLFLRLNVRSVGITINKFKKRKGALAPMGNRFYYGIKRSFVKSEILDKKTVYFSEILGSSFGHRDLNLDKKIGFNFLILGWSNSQIFWDKLILDIGFSLGLPLNFKYIIGGRGLDEIPFPGNTNNSNEQKYTDYDYDIFQRVLRHELIRFDISVGYLLF